MLKSPRPKLTFFFPSRWIMKSEIILMNYECPVEVMRDTWKAREFFLGKRRSLGRIYGWQLFNLCSRKFINKSTWLMIARKCEFRVRFRIFRCCIFELPISSFIGEKISPLRGLLDAMKCAWASATCVRFLVINKQQMMIASPDIAGVQIQLTHRKKHFLSRKLENFHRSIIEGAL